MFRKGVDMLTCVSESTIDRAEILDCLKKVEGLFNPKMVEQLRGDWTSTEEGIEEQKDSDRKSQTFDQFAPPRRQPVKQKISIGFLRIGVLPDGIEIDRLAEFVRAYLCVEVRDLGQIETNEILSRHRRALGDFVPQTDANGLLEDILRPRREISKEFGLIALTNEDLFCDMNDPLDYVYGYSQAFNGVASTRRLWQPEAVGLQLSTIRLYKLVTHEIGHLLGLKHCLNHACNMNGVETVDQFDRHPLDLCPQCMAKVCWITQVHPKERYRRLVQACSKLGLAGTFYEQFVTRLERCLASLS